MRAACSALVMGRAFPVSERSGVAWAAATLAVAACKPLLAASAAPLMPKKRRLETVLMNFS
jgi:hypothetical protein